MFIRIMICALVLMVLSPIANAAETKSDTIMVLGGPNQWNGRFENSDGLPDWHGWTHADLYDSPSPSPWNASDHLPIDGQYSGWCGTWFENDCLDGYGNGWEHALQFTLPANDPALPTTVRWQASVEVDCEPGYDSLNFFVGQGSAWTSVGMSLDGNVTLDLDLTFTIAPQDYIDGKWHS